MSKNRPRTLLFLEERWPTPSIHVSNNPFIRNHTALSALLALMALSALTLASEFLSSVDSCDGLRLNNSRSADAIKHLRETGRTQIDELILSGQPFRRGAHHRPIG